MTLSTREQFDKALDDADRLVGWLAQTAAEPLQPLLATIASHLAFARHATTAGRVPRPEEKAGLALTAAGGYLPASVGEPSLDQAIGWLRTALPSIELFFRALEPTRSRPESLVLGTQVTVRLPDGSRRLGFIRCPHETSCLVAFGSGQQQWVDPQMLESAPRAGERVAVVAAGSWHVATVVEFASGCYLVELGEGKREWFEWTAVATAQAP